MYLVIYYLKNGQQYTYLSSMQKCIKLGYKGTGTYTNGKLTVGDISPFNVGYINGNLRLIDADIYRKGGKLLLPK